MKILRGGGGGAPKIFRALKKLGGALKICILQNQQEVGWAGS